MRDKTARHHRADLVQLETQATAAIAKVAAAAAHGPEQVRILRCCCPDGRPSASTIIADRKLSSAMPNRGISQPNPPPSVRPATPVLETTPPVVARPNCWVSRLNSRQSAPPPRSMPSYVPDRRHLAHRRQVDHDAAIDDARPATLCPPPRTATSMPAPRASLTASETSARPRQRATRAGRLSIAPLWTRRASSIKRSTRQNQMPRKRRVELGDGSGQVGHENAPGI